VLPYSSLKEKTFPRVKKSNKSQKCDGAAEDYETGTGDEYVEGSFDGTRGLGFMSIVGSLSVLCSLAFGTWNLVLGAWCLVLEIYPKTELFISNASPI